MPLPITGPDPISVRDHPSPRCRSTLDRTGSDVEGHYSLHEYDTTGSTVFRISISDGQATQIESSTESDNETLTATTYASGTVVRDKTGNEIDGDYSLFETDRSTSTAYDAATSTDGSTDPDNSFENDGGSDRGTNIQIATSTIDRTGNAKTTDYTLYQIDTTNSTVYAASTTTSTGTAASTATDHSTITVSPTTFASGSSTVDKTGNEKANEYTLYQHGSSNSTVYNLSVNSDSEVGAAGETDGGGSTATSTNIAINTTDLHSTRYASGSFSYHQVDTTDSSVFGASSGSDGGTEAEGSTDGDNQSSGDTSYAYDTNTQDKSGSTSSTDYSLHQVQTHSSTAYTRSTMTVTGTSADTSTNRDTVIGTGTNIAYDTTTLDRSGNENSTSYSLHQRNTNDSTNYGASSDVGTETGADTSNGGASGGGLAKQNGQRLLGACDRLPRHPNGGGTDQDNNTSWFTVSSDSKMNATLIGIHNVERQY